MSIELVKRLLVDQQAVLHAGSWGHEPARIWMIDPAGAGPAAVDAALRDLETLAAVDEDALLGLLSSGQLDSGRLWAAVIPTPDVGLHELLAKRGPLTLPQLRTLARSLCSALAALHQHGILHGGLAPSLVRYASATDDETPPRVTGAGWSSLRRAWLARADAPAEHLCRLAPEQLTGVAVGADRHADIFATGCLLYEAATGAPAFAGASRAQVEAALTGPDRPDIRDVLGPAEEPLARVLGRCLAVSAKDRYPSVTTLWRELAPALGSGAEPIRPHHTGPIGLPADEAQSTTPASPIEAQRSKTIPPGRTSTRSRRGSVLLTVGLTLGAALVAAVILLLVRGGFDPAAPPPGDDAAGTKSSNAVMAAMSIRHNPRHGAMRQRVVGVPPRVRPKAGALRIEGLLARVGLTGGEVVIDHALATDYDLAVQALHDNRQKAFSEAALLIERATRPELCRTFLEKKQFYVKNGIRVLSKRLGQWQRFRIERSMADTLKSKGGCRAVNRRLTPLVEEIRDRMVDRRR